MLKYEYQKKLIFTHANAHLQVISRLATFDYQRSKIQNPKKNGSLRLLKTRQQDTTINPHLKKTPQKQGKNPPGISWRRVNWAILQLLQLEALLQEAAGAQAQHQALLGHQGPGLVQGKMKDLGIQGAQLLARE